MLPGKNDPCICNSGKKFRKCCGKNGKRPRFVGIGFSLHKYKSQIQSEKDITIKVKTDSAGVHAQVFVKGVEIETNAVKGYPRPNKPLKVLSQVMRKPGESNLDLLSHLESFDSLVAIDTNCMVINDKKQHLGVALAIHRNLDKKGVIIISLHQGGTYPISGEIDKPENHNWRELIKVILRSNDFHHDNKYGIIVDSDLGNIDMFNSRQLPIIEDFFLPPNFELMYASDAAADNILNHAIRACEKTSNQLLKEFADSQ